MSTNLGEETEAIIFCELFVFCDSFLGKETIRCTADSYNNLLLRGLGTHTAGSGFEGCFMIPAVADVTTTVILNSAGRWGGAGILKSSMRDSDPSF